MRYQAVCLPRLHGDLPADLSQMQERSHLGFSQLAARRSRHFHALLVLFDFRLASSGSSSRNRWRVRAGQLHSSIAVTHTPEKKAAPG